MKRFDTVIYTHHHLSALRLWWHIGPRGPPAHQSLPHSHDLRVRVAPSALSLLRSVQELQVVLVPNGRQSASASALLHPKK